MLILFHFALITLLKYYRLSKSRAMRQLKLESNRSHDLNVTASEVNIELGVN